MTINIQSVPANLFSPHIGSEVTMETEQGQTLTTTLSSVTENPKATPPDALRIGFDLILTVPLPCTWDSGDYTLTHAALGRVGPVNVTRVFPGTIDQPNATFQIIIN